MSANHSFPCHVCQTRGPVICHAFNAAWRQTPNMRLLTEAKADTLILEAAMAINERPRPDDRKTLQQMQQMQHNLLAGRHEDEDCVQGMFEGEACTSCVQQQAD